jgi:hypothetical protein
LGNLQTTIIIIIRSDGKEENDDETNNNEDAKKPQYTVLPVDAAYLLGFILFLSQVASIVFDFLFGLFFSR